MALPNSAFANVPLNTREPNACSPAQPPLPWTGIVIQSPTRVAVSAAQPNDSVVLPVCGFYRLDMSSLLDGQPLMLVAVNLATGQRYAGPMLDPEDNPVVPPPGRPALDPARLKGMLSSSNFNPDFSHYVPLPGAAAHYEVHVEYGGMASNRVQVEVVVR